MGSAHTVYLLALYNTNRLLAQCFFAICSDQKCVWAIFAVAYHVSGGREEEKEVVGGRNAISVPLNAYLLRRGLKNEKSYVLTG